MQIGLEEAQKGLKQSAPDHVVELVRISFAPKPSEHPT